MSWAYSFRGQSGKVYEFQKVEPGGDLAHTPGVALFAAPDSYGWRIIRIAELTGREGDMRLALALTEARRYGGDAMLVAACLDEATRRAMIADLERGLSPLWSGGHGTARLAAAA